MPTDTRVTQLDEMVRVSNEGQKPMRLALNSRVHDIPPGQEKLVPAEAAIAFFGDWEARGDRRAEEVTRIRGLYGALSGMKREHRFDDGTIKELTDIDLWDMNQPKFKIFLLDGTEVVSTVVGDPQGHLLGEPTQAQPESEQIQYLSAMIHKQQALLEELMAQQGPTDVEYDRPENAPKQVRSKPRVQAPRPDELD